MTRTLKVLGLALLAAFTWSVALSSVGSADGGEEFTAGSYPATLHSGSGTHSFTFSGRKFECNTTFSGELTEASEELKLIPKYNECTTSIGGFKKPAATFAFCEEGLKHRTFIFFTETECAKNYIHLVTVYNDAGTTEVLCVYELSENEGESVTHEDLGGTSGVQTTWNVGGIPYKRTSGSALLCGPAESTTTYSGSSTVTAKDSEGEAISFDVG